MVFHFEEALFFISQKYNYYTINNCYSVTVYNVTVLQCLKGFSVFLKFIHVNVNVIYY